MEGVLGIKRILFIQKEFLETVLNKMFWDPHLMPPLHFPGFCAMVEVNSCAVCKKCNLQSLHHHTYMMCEERH